MNTVSLFDGMACGALGMQAAGIDIENYEAFEIDKYAIQTATHNFPFIKQHGDVFNAKFTQFEGADLVCGGSPCTKWSIAQKNDRETEDEGEGWDLFSQYARAIEEIKPKYFIYENNKSMSTTIRDSISNVFDFEPIHINSALVSAQNRHRLYWVGKRKPNGGGYSKIEVEQPADKGILLRDILESGVADREKAYCLKHQAGNARDYIKKHHTQVAFEPIRIGTIENNLKNPSFDSKQYRVYSPNGKSTTLCGQGGGLGAKTGLYLCPTDSFEQQPVYEVKNGFIKYKDIAYPINLEDGFYIIRKLTVKECMRLQTVPEWYQFPVSDTQAYKMLGNGWTVDVIAHLMSYMK